MKNPQEEIELTEADIEEIPELPEEFLEEDAEEEPSLEDLIKQGETRIKEAGKAMKEIEKKGEARVEKVAGDIDISEKQKEKIKDEMGFKERKAGIIEKMKVSFAEMKERAESLIGEEEIGEEEIIKEEKDKTGAERYAEKGFEMVSKTVASEAHPDRNEDAVLMMGEKQVFGVFDGLGGHASGDEASNIAKATVEQSLRKLPPKASLEETEEAVKKALVSAHEEVRRAVEKDIKKKGMASTASIVKIFEDKKGKKAVIGNVGDSRVYVLRDNGQLEQITLDDNTLTLLSADKQEARKRQNVFNNITAQSELSEKGRRLFNQRNQIIQAIGSVSKGLNFSPNIYTIDIKEGDSIFVASDGICDNLTDNEMAGILSSEKNNSKAINKLINAAQERSRDKNHLRAKKDDMSGVIYKVKK